MKRILACLAALAFATVTTTAPASPARAETNDPIGDLIGGPSRSAIENAADWSLRATLYHSGKRGLGSRDSLGCKVAPMRTVAVDPAVVSRHSIIFIKETVGLALPDGSVHDGYWYASDIGGGIKGERIDLFTGYGAASMRALQGLNLHQLTVTKAGSFAGCPPLDGGAARVADAR